MKNEGVIVILGNNELGFSGSWFFWGIKCCFVYYYFNVVFLFIYGFFGEIGYLSLWLFLWRDLFSYFSMENVLFDSIC